MVGLPSDYKEQIIRTNQKSPRDDIHCTVKKTQEKKIKLDVAEMRVCGIYMESKNL